MRNLVIGTLYLSVILASGCGGIEPSGGDELNVGSKTQAYASSYSLWSGCRVDIYNRKWCRDGATGAWCLGDQMIGYSGWEKIDGQWVFTEGHAHCGQVFDPYNGLLCSHLETKWVGGYEYDPRSGKYTVSSEHHHCHNDIRP